MRTIVDKYRRPLLAIFGVLLMIVFILPANLQPGGGQNNPVVGHIGKDEVHAAEMAAAESDWGIVSQQVVYRDPQAQDPRNPWVPISAARLGPQAHENITTNRDAYLLLLKEAELRGMSVAQSEVDEFLENPRVAIVDQRNRRIIPFADVEDVNAADRIRGAVGRLMLVQRSFESALDTIKVSQPVRRQFLAEQIQSVNLNLVSIPASQFTPTNPTPQQLEEHFKKYANVDPEDINQSPLGYGYRFPNRVKLQVIDVPVGQIRAAAERARSKDDYQWDRDAFKYYTANQSEFPTTAPAPTTGTVTATSARPTTRPFAEVKQDARRAVLDGDIARLTQRIVERLTSTITSDYVAYRNAINTGGANANIPASSVGPAYNTYEYLQSLAALIQKEFELLPPTRSFDKDYLTAQDLLGLPGFGQAMAEGEPVARYVFTRAAAFTTEKDDARTLQPYEPAPVARDTVGNAYVFRLIDAQAAHAPTSLQEVAAAVEADVRAASSYAQAKKVAEDLITKAKQSGSLESAAAAGNYKVTPLNGVRFNDPTSVASLTLASPIAQRSFLRQAGDLMASITDQNRRPTGLVELPREGRAVAAQITDVQTIVTSPSDLRLLESQAALQATRILATPLLNNWFRYDAIAARLGYTPAAGQESQSQNTPATPERAPRQPIL